jgi:hypothetical protein
MRIFFSTGKYQTTACNIPENRRRSCNRLGIQVPVHDLRGEDATKATLRKTRCHEEVLRTCLWLLVVLAMPFE